MGRLFPRRFPDAVGTNDKVDTTQRSKVEETLYSSLLLALKVLQYPANRSQDLPSLTHLKHHVVGGTPKLRSRKLDVKE